MSHLDLRGGSGAAAPALISAPLLDRQRAAPTTPRYGVEARQAARRTHKPKTNARLAACMEAWVRQQAAHIARAGYHFRAPGTPLAAPPRPSLDCIEHRVAAAAERLRALHECGEIEWNDVSQSAAYALAFMS